MRITKQLNIRGEHGALESLLARVEDRLHDGWKRDRAAEERRRRRSALWPWESCFSCTAKADRPAAAFYIHARSPGELYVSHVIPLEKQQLSEEEQHRILAEFEREFLRPAAAEVGVKTDVVQHRLPLEHDLSSEAVRLLKAFSASANRACLHPNDRRRWNAFLIRAHEEESLFDSALLDEWLWQEGWPEETRCQLMAEYEAGWSLLLAYDEEAPTR